MAVIEIESIELDRANLLPALNVGDMAGRGIEEILAEIELTHTNMFSPVTTPTPDGLGRWVIGWRKNNIENANETWMRAWQEEADGAHVPGREYVIYGVNRWKIDGAVLAIKGLDIHIITVAHSYLPQDVDPNTGWRPSAMGLAVIPGIYTPIPTPAPVPVPTPNPEPPTPCVLPGNRDYFKPNNPFTRAQAMKVIAIMAAGSADAVPDTTTQTFEDVPVGSTFHKFIEYVFGKGAINGYDCTPE